MRGNPSWHWTGSSKVFRVTWECFARTLSGSLTATWLPQNFRWGSLKAKNDQTLSEKSLGFTAAPYSRRRKQGGGGLCQIHDWQRIIFFSSQSWKLLFYSFRSKRSKKMRTCQDKFNRNVRIASWEVFIWQRLASSNFRAGQCAHSVKL